MTYEKCRRCGGAVQSRSAKSWGLCWYQGSRAEGTDRSTDCAYGYAMWLSIQPEYRVMNQAVDSADHQVMTDRWLLLGAPQVWKAAA